MKLAMPTANTSKTGNGTESVALKAVQIMLKPVITRRGLVLLAGLLASPAMAQEASLHLLTKAPSDPDELRRLVKAGKLWRGSCKKHTYGYIVADKNPYSRLGTKCPFDVTPVGGGPSGPCPWALKFYKEDEKGLESFLREHAKEKN